MTTLRPSDATLTAAVQRRALMYLQFQRLAQRVRDIVETVAEEHLIRCSVQHRIKAGDRLLKKLLSWRDKGKLDGLETPEAVLGRVGDIAAVRVTTYLERDRARLSEKLRERLNVLEVEMKDRDGSLYRAIHLQAGLREEDMEAQEDQALGSLSCEVQICTLLSHVYSEIEHDLRYKPLSGEISVDEKRLLDALGHLTLTGDQIILSLIERSEERIREGRPEPQLAGAAVDAVDLMTMLQPRLGFLARPKDNAASVLRFLAALGLQSAGDIESKLLVNDVAGRWAALRAKVDEQVGLTQQPVGTKTVPYDPETADGLLLLAVSALPSEIRKLLADRRPGRPSREVTLASHLLDAVTG